MKSQNLTAEIYLGETFILQCKSQTFLLWYNLPYLLWQKDRFLTLDLFLAKPNKKKAASLWRKWSKIENLILKNTTLVSDWNKLHSFCKKFVV